ncbi:energy transducer TonB [Caulobacter endophyticus]|uniref:Protein TonB n=1 Tax=Caulobacter endophyticus TaxID=2172652 RepID=A0A2T9JEV1_9CAUL|nr:energy transducer TonB [Caulobacter endophyticus]PVM82224.1 energy transducer TonB [Caulobacter endophyticus]
MLASLPMAVLEIPCEAPAASGRKRRWSLAFTVAVALHVALLLGAYLRLSRPEAPPAAPIEAISVEFAVEPVAPLRPKDERPPGPEARASAAAIATPAPPKAIDRPPDPLGILPAVVRSAAKASEGEASARPSAPSEAAAPPTAPAPPAPVMAAPRTSAASARDAAISWKGLILGRLQVYKRYPRRAQSAGQEGVVHIAFTVDRGGKVLSARIAKGSGYPLLDDEALATVRRASPMPPPPGDVPGDPVEVLAPVEFFVR